MLDHSSDVRDVVDGDSAVGVLVVTVFVVVVGSCHCVCWSWLSSCGGLGLGLFYREIDLAVGVFTICH